MIKKVPELIVHMPDKDEIKELIASYLTNDVVNTVFIMSDEVCNLTKTDGEFCSQICLADTLLPSNNLMMREFVRNANGEVVEFSNQEIDYSRFEYNAFEEVMNVVANNCSTVFILTQEEKELEQCKIMLNMDAPKINSWEKCVSDIESASDMVLNEINGIAPDVLMCSFDSPLQEKWIMENKDKMNTKMVLGIGPGVSKAKKNKPTLKSLFRSLFKKK